MKFVKINNMWREVDETTELNNATVCDFIGRIEKNLNLTQHEIVFCDNWRDLNWKDTKLCDKNEKTGWLSPDGTFYGCKSEFHWMQATLVHKKTEFELEQEGFVKITLSVLDYKSAKAIFPAKFANKKLSPTVAQIEYLEKQTGIDCTEVFECFGKDSIKEDDTFEM